MSFLINIAKIIVGSDIAFINQEVMLTGEAGAYPNLAAPTENADALINAGFNVINLATNHTLDKGLKGLETCLETVYARPFDAVLGAFRTEEESTQLCILEKQGIRFGFLTCYDFYFYEAFAAIAPQKSQLKHHLRLFLVDIGGYTTDVLLLRQGKPDMQFCRSLETGVITMNNDIIRRVGALHDMQIEDEHISAVLAGKETILPEEVKDTIRKSAEQHAINILNQLRELKVDLRSNPAVFIGGGSALFRDYLEKSPLVASATFVESVNANAIGYQAMAEGQLSLQRA